MIKAPVALIFSTSVILSACGSSSGESTELAQATPTSPAATVSVPTAAAAIGLATEPTVVTCSANDEDMRLRFLDLINAARAQARSCGTKAFAATGRLNWNTQLLGAAKVHSTDMADHNFFSHTGSDGSSVGERATAAGFEWQAIGENIAAGQTRAEEVVNGWLDSPGHCENLMAPEFSDVSVACTSDSNSDFTHYWTNVLGASF